MAKGKFKKGDKAVMRKGDDAIVYSIDELYNDNGMAKLSYLQGKTVLTAGAMPVSTLLKPTKKQLTLNGY